MILATRHIRGSPEKVLEHSVLPASPVSELRALKKITTRPPAHAGGPRLPRQSGAERRARLRDGRCPVHGRVFDLRNLADVGAVVGQCTRTGCDVFAVVEEGIWKLPEQTAHLLADNHLDDADALLTLARCLSRAESRASNALREAIEAELSLYKSAWLDEPLIANDG
jgi:hypothetical protein